MFEFCLVLAPRKIPCRYGRLIERLLLKVIAKQSLVLPMYLRHFKTVLCWPTPDRPCVHLTIVWWTLPLWKPVPCQRWHWHGWELWRSGTLGCQLLSLTWSRPRWLTLGSGAIQKWNFSLVGSGQCCCRCFEKHQSRADLVVVVLWYILHYPGGIHSVPQSGLGLCSATIYGFIFMVSWMSSMLF